MTELLSAVVLAQQSYNPRASQTLSQRISLWGSRASRSFFDEAEYVRHGAERLSNHAEHGWTLGQSKGSSGLCHMQDYGLTGFIKPFKNPNPT